tara:strand:+ start:36547 stop:37989 length:1443 start_codon:yes stop_codon:yes gene_type:complete
MKRDLLLPLILCGGTGSRLWPLSRESYPKQYLALSADTSKTLLQQTLERISGVENQDNPIFICNEEHRFIVAEQLREINVKPKTIILEPFARNTAPAIAISALKASEDGSDPVLLVLASDHVIKDCEQFLKSIKAAKKLADQGKLVTFGIIPTSPEVGYGYIESVEPLEINSFIASPISKFIEKPDLEKAKKLASDPRFTWNSGMFLFKASVFLKELQKYSPEVLKSCSKALKENNCDMDFQRLDKEAFKECPSISVDVAVMEKTKSGSVLPLNVGWSDVGSWKSIWEVSKKDENGNVLLGNVITKNLNNCYVRSESRLVVGLGVQNLLIVETNDAILVAEKNHDQDVKKIVNKLKKENRDEGKNHRKVYRPWGNYTSIEQGSRWQVKRIEVKPNASLSLQMHHHRAEHWIVVTGTAKVEINEENLLLGENQSVYIPLGSKHRLTNPGRIPLVLIEVQSGSYLSEDDIVRLDDVYGRINN